MLRWHRLCAILIFPLLFYVVVTGAGIQMWDMIALVRHAPATDADMLMMRQHIHGPPNYAVVSAPDYTAAALPAELDYSAQLAQAAALGHGAAPGAALRLVELRMVGGRLAGHVQMGARHLIFDLASRQQLPAADLPPPEPGRAFSSPRGDFKYFHRFNYLGQPATGFDGLAGFGLTVMIITGLLQYLRLWKARSRQDRRAAFWRGGSLWRALHRWISLGASVLVLWIALSGLALSIDNFEPLLVGLVHPRPPAAPGAPSGFDGDLSAPIADGDLPGMTRVVQKSFGSAVPHTGIKVFRLRYFAGYAQGVIVADDDDTTQYVFNARTGAAMSMHEKGYPDLGFPSGWEWHQRLKRIHRGDIFGMTGRWLDTLGAAALLYLLVSGSVMYAQLWQRRARGGRKAIIWK